MKNIRLNVSQQRQFEGEVRLQSVGVKQGIKAKNLMIGDDIVFNFGATNKVVAIEVSKTGKTLNVTLEYTNFMGELTQSVRKFRSETIVVVKELNPVVEVVEATESVEEATTIEADGQTYVQHEALKDDEVYIVKVVHSEENKEVKATSKDLNEIISLYGDVIKSNPTDKVRILKAKHKVIEFGKYQIPVYNVIWDLPKPSNGVIVKAKMNLMNRLDKASA